MTLRRERRRRQAGFSLMEVIVALALIGLCVSMASQLLHPKSERLRLESTIRGFCAAVRVTRARAVSSNTETTIIIDVGNKSYYSAGSGSGMFPSNAVIALDVASTRRLSATMGSVAFYPDGASSGGDVGIETSGAHGEVHINWLTGDVKCTLG